MSLIYQNQGQQIALGWNVSTLIDITALYGTDGERFLAVTDRGKYSPGQFIMLATGSFLYSGTPTVSWVHPFMTDGQIETWLTYVGAVTIRYHITDSVGRTDTQKANAYLNFDQNQLANLQRTHDGWRDVVSSFVIKEVI